VRVSYEPQLVPSGGLRIVNKVGRRDALGVEIGAALAILGLLLVFLPLFIQAAADAAEGKEPQKERRARKRRAWAVPIVIAVAATDAMLGLLTLWGTWHAAAAAGWMLVALTWLVVGLSGWAVRTGVR
jgi:hypothetical protein